MANRQLTLIVFTTILVCGILFMICAWVRFNRLETKSLELESDVYVLKLVQEELLKQHGLHLEIEMLDPKVGAIPKIGFEQNQTEQDKP